MRRPERTRTRRCWCAFDSISSPRRWPVRSVHKLCAPALSQSTGRDRDEQDEKSSKERHRCCTVSRRGRENQAVCMTEQEARRRATLDSEAARRPLNKKRNARARCTATRAPTELTSARPQSGTRSGGIRSASAARETLRNAPFECEMPV